MNYFTIGLPSMLVAYWIIRPRKTLLPADTRPFLKKVLPFALVSAVFQAIGLLILFMIFNNYLHIHEINSLLVISCIIMSFPFFIFAPKVYQGDVDRVQLFQIVSLGLIELILLFLVFQVPFLLSFFNISTTTITIQTLMYIAVVSSPFYLIQFLVAKNFLPAQNLKHQ